MAQCFHQLCCGASFFSDHKQLGKFYEEYDASYDSLVEQAIGLGGSVKLAMLMNLQEEAAGVINQGVTPSEDCTTYFKVLLKWEASLCREIDKLMGQSPDNGTQNLLQGLCTESQNRTYLMTRRVK